MRAEQVLHLQEGQKLRDFVLGRDGVNDPIKAAGHCLQRPLIISLKLRQLCSSDTPVLGVITCLLTIVWLHRRSRGGAMQGFMSITAFELHS